MSIKRYNQVIAVQLVTLLAVCNEISVLFVFLVILKVKLITFPSQRNNEMYEALTCLFFHNCNKDYLSFLQI
jgi:hypothetical protein